MQQIGTNTHSTTTPSQDGPGAGGCSNNNQEGFMAMAGAGGSGDVGCGGAEDGDCGGSGNRKSTSSMSERARLARLPQPVPGLNCPRCDSTNTKFCYFNNYSLTQPRHFCRSCRRYWTRGGALRNVPMGGAYRRHAKRRAKPKMVSDTSGDAIVGTWSVASVISRGTTYATSTSTVPIAFEYTMSGSVPWHNSQLTDNFDPASLVLGFPDRLLFADSRAYTMDDCAQHQHHHAHGNGMEQWAAAQVDNFPFMHDMDHQMSGLPAEAMPITMATMQGMFHLGLDSLGNGGHQFQHSSTRRNHKKQDYPSNRVMYEDVVNGNGCGYI
ncbi:hypothetical protein ZWY2020_026019 [Hordeum vulgare]|nr:hypothetical protein ZWY2020_026019 [Hordeum vulgare]